MAVASTALARDQVLNVPINDRHLIPGLDALRALAVTLVLAFHFGVPGVSGPLGVMVFFVLSGFLITGILLKEFDKTGTLLLKRFYTRRAFRIFPTFYACWLLTIALMLIHHLPGSKLQELASFFYLTDYVRALAPDSAQTAIPMWISWSLAIEEQFYLLWPLLLLFLLRRTVRPARILCYAIVGLWIYRAILVSVLRVPWTYIYNAFDTRVDALLTGSLLAIVVRRNGWQALRSSLTRSPRLLIVPLAALFVFSLVDTHNVQATTPEYLLCLSFEPVIVGVCLIQIVHWSATVWGFLEHRSIKTIARWSYALYLYHVIALEETPRLISHHIRPVAALTTFALAAASYHLLERPFLRIRDKRISS